MRSPVRAALSAGAGLLAIVLVFTLIVLSYRDFVPYWDALSYFNCITIAVHRPFDLYNFRCVGHPSVAYLFLLGITQYIAPWNVALMCAVNAALGVASIAAFHAILRVLFSDRQPIEHLLVTALYAFTPLFVAHAIFLNTDYGLTTLFVLFLYFLFMRQFWVASITAVAMMLTKEVGAVAFVVSVVAYIAASAGEPARQGLKALAPLAAAPVVIVVYIVAGHLLHPDPNGFLAAYLALGMVYDRVGLVFSLNPMDAGLRSFLADIFVLNWQWIYSLVIVVAGCAVLLRRAVRPEIAGVWPGTGRFLAFVLIGLVYAVTRYRGWNNARYVLVVSPVLVLAFYCALLSVAANRWLRRACLAAVVTVVFLSNFRTLDFVSKAVFGTFRFGSHAMLDMPSLVGGLRLDSLVYNLEALRFEYLLTDMMEDRRPPPGSVLLMGNATYNFPPGFDAATYRPTVNPERMVRWSILADHSDARRDVLAAHGLRPGDLFDYIAFANADNTLLRTLENLYALVEAKQYVRDGYTLDVYSFRFSPAP